jgi:ribosomal-protein-alanine N-acetyltransferase
MTRQNKIIFETDRLLLRQQVTEDFEDLWVFHSNPENVKFYLDAPRTREEVRQELDWHLDWYQKDSQFGTWAIIHKETGNLIGLCSLMPWTIDGVEEVEMAYILDQEYRGGGLGSELSQAVVDYGFEKLNLSRMISLIEPENMTSRRVVEKTGMRFEREAQDESGQFLIYAIDKADRDSRVPER